jgi:glycosyltransferase involved in cell wall biosynthesis
MDRAPSNATTFPGRVGLQQMALSAFRVPVVERLARACDGGLCIFAGQRRAGERREPAPELEHARLEPARNLHLLSGPLALCWQRGLLDWLRAWDPDALIVEANPRTVSSARAIRWMQRRGRPVLGWGLGTMPLTPGLHGLRAMGRRRFLRRFDGMIAYSSRAAEEYRALGIAPQRIFVAHNAAAAAPAPAAPAPARHGAGPPTLLFVGRLVGGKRVDALIRAAAGLAPPPRLIIVGDGPARADLEALAREVFPAAEFPGGVFDEALAPVFAQADLFVLPGLGGLAVQQAMAHGLPVVVAEGDGTQFDLVRPGNGWHVQGGDVEALRRTLQEALSDPPRLRAMGAESRRIIAQEINLDTMVASIVNALRWATMQNPRKDR